MSENNLKPCPFCGCDVIEIEPMNRWRKSITCKNCHVKFVAPDDAALTRLWNTRKPMERIEELTEKLKKQVAIGDVYTFADAVEIVKARWIE